MNKFFSSECSLSDFGRMPTYMTNESGLNIRIDSYYPKKPTHAHALVMFLHGMSEYGSRYEHIFNYFTDHGIIVVAPTFQGFGLSGGEPRIISSFERIVDDLLMVSDHIDTLYDFPRFIVAHSMGGAVATMLASQFPSTWAGGGVVLSSPQFGFALNSTFPGFGPIVRLLAWLAPSWCPRRIPPQYMTSAAEFLHEEEALLREGIPMRTIRTMLTMLDTLPGLRKDCDFPTLVFIPESDKVVDSDATRAFIDSCASEDNSVVTVDGGLHELLRDTRWEEVAEHTVDWILDRCEGVGVGSGSDQDTDRALSEISIPVNRD